MRAIIFPTYRKPVDKIYLCPIWHETSLVAILPLHPNSGDCLSMPFCHILECLQAPYLKIY